jgi:plastocyanin
MASSSGGSANTVSVAIPAGASTNTTAAGYDPDKVTVVIGVNNTIVWTNDDSVNHTVYSTCTPAGAVAFTSPLIAPGGSYNETFTVAGTYTYHCNLHPWMTGIIIVESGSTKPA